MISRRLTYRSCFLFLTPLDRHCRLSIVSAETEQRYSASSAVGRSAVCPQFLCRRQSVLEQVAEPHTALMVPSECECGV